MNLKLRILIVDDDAGLELARGHRRGALTGLDGVPAHGTR